MGLHGAGKTSIIEFLMEILGLSTHRDVCIVVEFLMGMYNHEFKL
jgi:hypothetical protein